MYKDPLQALLLPLSYPYVQGPTTSTSAASVLPLCARTHYKHFCCLCPTLMCKDPLQALLPPLSYLYVQLCVCCVCPRSPAVNNRRSIFCCHMRAHLLHKGDGAISLVGHSMVWPGNKLEVVHQALLVPLERGEGGRGGRGEERR